MHTPDPCTDLHSAAVSYTHLDVYKRQVYEPDADAEYVQTYDIDLSAIKPTVAFPHLPENTKTIDEVGDVPIQQVVIGSCTNGRLSDMKTAAEILKGHKVHKDVRAIIIPATQKIYRECIKEGYLDIFVEAGCVVSTPTLSLIHISIWVLNMLSCRKKDW